MKRNLLIVTIVMAALLVSTVASAQFRTVRQDVPVFRSIDLITEAINVMDQKDKELSKQFVARTSERGDMKFVARGARRNNVI